MTYSDAKNGHYIIRLTKGEDLHESLKKFCEKEGVNGTINGLGGSTDLSIGYYNTETFEYDPQQFVGKLYEVTNFSGNATPEFVHIHATIADEHHNAHAGHLLNMKADPTLEIAFTVTEDFTRVYEKEDDLNLLDLPNSL